MNPESATIHSPPSAYPFAVATGHPIGIADRSVIEYFDVRTDTFGPRWQTNAMAIYSGLADKAQYDAIWNSVLSTADKPGHTALESVPSYDYWCCSWLKARENPYHALTVAPYYSYYVISAMATTGHRVEALDWIRNYWGGMLAEGASSFWEAYDPSWPKRNFHAALEADGRVGYFVSLSHGWSSGPTAWLMEQILGIQPTAEAFRRVMIRPDLAGLLWAQGAEPTPHGLIRVNLKDGPTASIGVDIPNGVYATVLVPVPRRSTTVIVTGEPMTGKLVEDGHRLAIMLGHGGHCNISTGKASQ